MQRGARIFSKHPTAACILCHSLHGQGSTVGPALDGIASRKDAAYIQESLLEPNKVLAEGFQQLGTSPMPPTGLILKPPGDRGHQSVSTDTQVKTAPPSRCPLSLCRRRKSFPHSPHPPSKALDTGPVNQLGPKMGIGAHFPPRLPQMCKILGDADFHVIHNVFRDQLDFPRKILHQGGHALHPITRIIVCDAVDLSNYR
jgi:cytochrome c551/c552